MKLATFVRTDGEPAVGVVDTGRGPHPRSRARPPSRCTAGRRRRSPRMLALIEAGEPALDRARAVAAQWPGEAEQPLAGTRLLSPLPVPQQIRDCLVFEQHLVNAMKQWEKMTGRQPAPISPLWYQRPTWYKGNRFSFVGHEADVIWPPYSELMDFELELACVIGRKGRDITPRERRSITCSASPSSTTSRRATCRCRSGRSAWGR